jgi:hypothetical protein
MNFNIWTAEISVAFKIIVGGVFFGVFFFSYMLQINLFLNYLFVIFLFFVFILKADESDE